MKSNRPPHIARRFLKFYCNEKLVETIEGDLEEQFEEDLGLYGKRKARRRFSWNVVRFFRPGIIKSLEGTRKLTNYGMFKNDFKTALRIIRKEKLYTSINVLGLTSGLVIALMILFYVKFELSYESGNPKADRIARITMDYMDGETLIDQDCETYHVLGPMLKEEFPEVKEFARAFRLGETIVTADQKKFRTIPWAVDPSFLSIFNYPLLRGDDASALQSPDEVVLTETIARTYFGTTDVVGETIKLSIASDPMKVVGVIEDSPANTHLKFELLFSYTTTKGMLDKRESVWNNNDTFTYLELTDSEKFSTFEQSVAQLTKKLNENESIENERIAAQRIEDIHLYSDKSYEAEQNGEASTIYFLFGVALLVIIIAIVNYINLSTAKSLDRAKEVGIRKVVGSSTGQLRVRFFIESLLINIFAGVLSLGLIGTLFGNFKQLAGLPLTMEIFTDTTFWAAFSLLLIISIVLSGSFPAFILSSFKTLSVLKGKFTHSAGGVVLRKALVIFQFSIAIFLLVQTFTATKQLDYMQEKDLGLAAEQVLVVHAPQTKAEMDNYGTFKNELLSRATIKSASTSTCVPGLPTSMMGSTTGINLVGALEEHSFNFFIYYMDDQLIPTMQMDLLAGENFLEGSENEGKIIVNEETMRLWGLSNPEEAVNQKVDFWGSERTISGVLKNFHQTGVKSEHIPMIFIYGDFGDYVSVRLTKGDLSQQMEDIKELYESQFANSPFEFFFLDQKFDSHYKTDQQFQKVFRILSTFAILITCLGLFGLASFTVAKRAKEIGIRKVLGASVPQIITLLSKDFVILVVVSAVIAIPVTYFLIQNWLATYAFRIDVNLWFFVGPALLIILVAFATVFSQTLKISNANPVESLRDE